MANPMIDITPIEPRVVYGLWMDSNDKTISKDIKTLARRYRLLMSSPRRGKILPFFVLSKDYNAATGDFSLLVGSDVYKDGLSCFVIPPGEYARVTVKPKLGLFWGMAIGAAKRYFYNQWLPQSSYQPLNMEYEYHVRRSGRRQNAVEFIFAIASKDQF